MLDTHARKLFQPFFDRIAQALCRRGIGPERVTLWGAAVGVLAAAALALGWTYSFVFLLWLSGLADAVDGTLARQSGAASRAGAMLDIVCDRLVEVAVLVAFGLRFPAARLELLVLSGMIILSLTVFLSAAVALPNSSTKSFHYQAGLAERSEGFVFFSIMALWPQGMPVMTLLFALAVACTAAQRVREALRLFRD